MTVREMLEQYVAGGQYDLYASVVDIVRNAIEDGGFDGLYYPDECACDLEDLAPCNGGPWPGCRAGLKTMGCDCGEGHAYHIGLDKVVVADAVMDRRRDGHPGD